jgi:hypothetical protein
MIGATRKPRCLRGPRQRRSELGGGLRRRGAGCVRDGCDAGGRGESSNRPFGQARHGRPGARRGLRGGTGRAPNRRGALGRRAVRTLVARRGEHRSARGLARLGAVRRSRGRRRTRSGGAPGGHCHCRVAGRPAAVLRTMSAQCRAVAGNAANGQHHHQHADQKPQMRHRAQQQPPCHGRKIIASSRTSAGSDTPMEGRNPRYVRESERKVAVEGSVTAGRAVAEFAAPGSDEQPRTSRPHAEHEGDMGGTAGGGNVRTRGADRNRTDDGGFADLCLTTWLRRPGPARARNIASVGPLRDTRPRGSASGKSAPRNHPRMPRRLPH